MQAQFLPTQAQSALKLNQPKASQISRAQAWAHKMWLDPLLVWSVLKITYDDKNCIFSIKVEAASQRFQRHWFQLDCPAKKRT